MILQRQRMLASFSRHCSCTQELFGLVADVRWVDRGGCSMAVLTADAALPAGTLLYPELLRRGRPWESLFAELYHNNFTGKL
jgi:hypothetical protein